MENQPLNPEQPRPIRAKFARLMGRDAIHNQVEVSPVAAEVPDINALLDEYPADGQTPLLRPDSEEARQLVAALNGNAPEESTFVSEYMGEDSKSVATVDATVDNPIKLSTKSFVYAAGMKDWDNGRDDRKGDSSSRKTIKNYARQNKDTAPPIGHVTVYVQPNGRVLASAVQDGAHRISAAHKRGDETVAVGKSIDIKRLPRDIIE